METENGSVDLLDQVNDPSERFGSYRNLVALKNFRFKEFYSEQKHKH
jgi:hypothetical protein